MEEGSINQIIHKAAYELAKKELNLKEEDKKNQTKLTILQQKLTRNESEIEEKVESIRKQVEITFNGTVLPKGIDMKAAEHVLNQITENGLSTPSEISIGEGVAKECLIEALKSSDMELEQITGETENKNDVLEAQEDDEIINEQEEIKETSNNWDLDVIFEIELPGGGTLKFIEPEDPMYDFASPQDRDEECIIETKKAAIRNIIYESARNAKTSKERDMYLKEFTQLLNDTDNGLGYDAALRFFDEAIISDEYDNDFFYSMLYSTIENISNGKAEEQGFREDNYTMLRKLNIISGILSKTDAKSLQTMELRAKLRELDPKLYNLVEKNPTLIEQLQEKFDEKDMQNVAIKLAGGSEALSREETLKQLNNIILEKALSNSKTMISTSIEILSSQESEEKKDNLQEVIIERLLAEKDNLEINSPESFEQKKKLFEMIIKRNVDNSKALNEQLVSDLTTIDIDAVKEVLKDKLIPDQNSKDSSVLKQYIQAFGNKINESSKKVLDAKKTSLSSFLDNSNKINDEKDEEGPEL